MPATEVNQWKRLLGVRKGSGWPFPGPRTARIDAALHIRLEGVLEAALVWFFFSPFFVKDIFSFEQRKDKF